MQTKQKVILGCTLAITLAAPMAQGAVTVTQSDAPVAVTVSGGTAALGGFNNSMFTFQASRNVALYADGNPTTVAVNAAALKGRQTFGGSSNGGSVAQCETAS
nr:hypothetical protein [Burkholderiales bacterium]